MLQYLQRPYHHALQTSCDFLVGDGNSMFIQRMHTLLIRHELHCTPSASGVQHQAIESRHVVYHMLIDSVWSGLEWQSKFVCIHVQHQL